MNDCITDVEGVRCGHATNHQARTGCTVVYTPEAIAAGVDVAGSAPATLETDGLHPGRLVQRVHAITLSGGSAYGLQSSFGVQKILEKEDIGFQTGIYRVPLVPAAAIFDLGVGDGSVRPGVDMGKTAIRSVSDQALETGQVGAGTGATVGKAYGSKYAQPGGVGTASITLEGDVTIGAVMVVNALGDVISPRTGEIVAGAYDPEAEQFLDSEKQMMELSEEEQPGLQNNTVIGVLATNMKLDCEACCSVAASSHLGIARSVRPAATMSDGDAMFAVSTGEIATELPIDSLKAAAPVVVSRAIQDIYQ